LGGEFALSLVHCDQVGAVAAIVGGSVMIVHELWDAREEGLEVGVVSSALHTTWVTLLFVAFAGLPIGLVLSVIHLVGIPITNLSVNPARSIGPAVFVGGWALTQLWLFIVAPLAGALLGALAHRWLFAEVEPIAPEESAVVAEGTGSAAA